MKLVLLCGMVNRKDFGFLGATQFRGTISKRANMHTGTDATQYSAEKDDSVELRIFSIIIFGFKLP